MLQNNIVPNIPNEQVNRQQKRFFLIPSLFVGVGGYAKAVFPRLDANFQNHYKFRPDLLPMAIFDFDEANSEVSLNGNGQKLSIKPYLVPLSKKILKDVSRKLKKNKKETIPFLKPYEGYVCLDKIKYVEAPGLNLLVQNANLAWRVSWQYVLPELTARVNTLYAVPNSKDNPALAEFVISNRSVIWVVAGGASTTGPSGLIPILSELKRIKPPETNLFGLVFTPSSYRDKSEAHKVMGRAIFRATMEQLFSIFDGKVIFDQPYGGDKHRISLSEEPFDQLFLVDGSLSGGRTNFKIEDLADLVARFLFRFSVGPLGENILGIIGNLNSGLRGGQE